MLFKIWQFLGQYYAGFFYIEICANVSDIFRRNVPRSGDYLCARGTRPRAHSYEGSRRSASRQPQGKGCQIIIAKSVHDSSLQRIGGNNNGTRRNTSLIYFLSIYLAFFLSIYLLLSSDNLSIYLSIYILYIYTSFYLTIHLSAYLSLCQNCWCNPSSQVYLLIPIANQSSESC